MEGFATANKNNMTAHALDPPSTKFQNAFAVQALGEGQDKSLAH